MKVMTMMSLLKGVKVNSKMVHYVKNPYKDTTRSDIMFKETSKKKMAKIDKQILGVLYQKVLTFYVTKNVK